MTLVPTLAGIAWDPQIRGILTVAVGAVVLIGSVYLLLLTNLGSRLGFQVALAGLFGWITLHSLFFWIYPPIQGPAGRVPAWEIEEINHGDLTQAALEEARDLDPSGLPDPEELTELTPEQAEELTEQNREQLGEWEFLAESDPTRSEIQSVIDAELAEGTVAGLSEPDTYVYRYAFETGGKPERKSDSAWDRLTNEITNSLRITHPPHYAVVQLQPALPAEEVPGQPPPTPEPDPDRDVISVVLVRDLGQRRVPAALTAIGAGAVFGLLCVMLHQRDKRVAEHRSAPLPEPAGSR